MSDHRMKKGLHLNNTTFQSNLIRYKQKSNTIFTMSVSGHLNRNCTGQRISLNTDSLIFLFYKV